MRFTQLKTRPRVWGVRAVKENALGIGLMSLAR
jgi:hypothetical protein